MDWENTFPNKQREKIMKKIFEYKEVEPKYAAVGVHPYESNGMHFTKFIYAKVSTIDNDFQNPARAEAILAEKTWPIEKAIRNKTYRGWGHVPPVVNDKGELVAGHHRLEAHKLEDQEYMWVALCTFDDAKAKWLYNNIENQESDSFADILSSNADLISSTLVAWSEKYFDMDGLEKLVQGYKKTPSDIRYIWETVQMKIGIKIDMHRTLGSALIKEEYGLLSTKVVHHQAHLALEDNIWNNARMMNRLIPLLTEGTDVNCIYKFNHTTSLKHLEESRTRLIEESNPLWMYDKLKPFMDACENGTVGTVTLNFPKQYESDSWKLDVETSNG